MDLRGSGHIYVCFILDSYPRSPYIAALPAHVSVSLYIPVVLSIADELEEAVSVPDHEDTQV